MTTSPTPEGFPHPHGPSPGGPPRYTPAPGQYGTGPHGQRSAPAPPEHKRLLNLTLASAGLYLLHGVVSMIAVAATDLAELYERMGVPAGQAGALTGRLGGLTTLTGLVGLALAAGLYALVYVFLKKGRNWARILGIVLAVLGAVNVLFGLLGSWLYGTWAIALIAVGLALAVVNVLWLVTALRAAVVHWFAQRSFPG